MKQKDAVYQAVTSVLNEQGHVFEDGMDIKGLMTRETRAQVSAILIAGFQKGTIDYSGDLPDESGLKEYVSGLVSNWVRKDPRFNGNTKYAPKNPGSRAGQGDEQLKNLRLFLNTRTTAAEKAEVQQYIDARVAELAAEKAKSVEVNTSVLPDSLKAKFGIA